MSQTSFEASIANTSAGLSANDELLRRCRAGEEDAYLIVYNQYAGQIFRLCMSLLQERRDAEEVLQDSFEYAFRKLDRYDSRKASFKTWLFQIAISRCRNKRRRKLLITIPINYLASRNMVDDTIVSPAESLDLNEQQQRVWQALGKLSPKLRETVVLRYYEGLTYKEIGLILSIPTKTAESRMRLAHKSLRKMLVDEDFPGGE